jgi:hypothetical protein
MLINAPGFTVGAKMIGFSANTITVDRVALSSSIGSTLTFDENINGGFAIHSVTANTFTYKILGLDGAALVSGLSRVERPGLAGAGSKVILTNTISSTESRIIGPYMWNPSAPFVLASNKGSIAQDIQAGKIIKLLNLNANDIPITEGNLIFDFGLESQEGPVRYLYKPTSNTIVIDPSYTFKFNHVNGSGVVLVGTHGPHPMSTLGTEYPAYVTYPSQARVILENLILSVKSAGIFVNFLVRYPEQLYATLDVYNSGIDPG